MTGFDDESAVQAWDPQTANVAGPDRRMFGFLIDVVILILIAAPFMVFLLGRQDAFSTAPSVPIELSLTLEAISGVYYVVFTALRGQTPGKMLMKTRVVDRDGGRIPSWIQSLIRWGIVAAAGAVPVLSFLTLVIYGWLLVDRRQQGLHDKAARTLVLDLRPALPDL